MIRLFVANYQKQALKHGICYSKQVFTAYFYFDKIGKFYREINDFLIFR